MTYEVCNQRSVASLDLANLETRGADPKLPGAGAGGPGVRVAAGTLEASG